ncbi:MAG: Ig-like domain-containing protein, partial [Nevskiaceae bacterium]
VLLRPAVPADTLYFRWNEGRDARYELVVKHAAGNPEFRRGVTTTRVPRSGPLRVLGTAEPGATVEVSNPRTGRGYATTADASGAFAIDAEARAGDTLSILSRTIVFRAPEPPRYSSSAESSP